MDVDRKLHLSKWIRAKRDKVYAAWTEPELMRQWFCPRELRLVSAEADVRVGGQFRAAMSNGTETYTVTGTYRELVPGQRLVFSHRWEEQDAVDTLVTVEFLDQDGGTIVSLTHEGFRSPESAKGHEGGWQSTFDSLEHFLASAAGGRAVSEAYSGSCHCGQVRFRVRFSAEQSSFKCNCSICQKTRAWLAPVAADALTLHSGEAELAEYQFAARKIRHRFCRCCGVKVFGQGTDARGVAFFAVSLAALDDIPAARLAALPISYFNGRHDDYLAPPSDISLL